MNDPSRKIFERFVYRADNRGFGHYEFGAVVIARVVFWLSFYNSFSTTKQMLAFFFRSMQVGPTFCPSRLPVANDIALLLCELCCVRGLSVFVFFLYSFFHFFFCTRFVLPFPTSSFLVSPAMYIVIVHRSASDCTLVRFIPCEIFVALRS